MHTLSVAIANNRRLIDYNAKIAINKAIVDYTSSMLCTPVTRFPPIGDAAYRQHAGGGPSHGHVQHAQKFGKDRACGSWRTYRHTDRHKDRHTHQNTSQPLPRAK